MSNACWYTTLTDRETVLADCWTGDVLSGAGGADEGDAVVGTGCVQHIREAKEQGLSHVVVGALIGGEHGAGCKVRKTAVRCC